MPPKSKKKTKHSQGSKASSATPLISGTASVLQELRGQIKAHKAFGDDYESSGPAQKVKGIGGRYPTFDLKEFKVKVDQPGGYVCGGCLLWAADTCTGIPVRNSAVQDSIRLNFPDGPAPINEVLVIAVPCITYDPMEHKGALEAVSPEEDRLVVLRAVVKDINNPKKMQLWAAHLHNVPVRFELLASMRDKFFRDVSLREQVVARKGLVARTTYGRMLEIWNFKATTERTQGKLANAKLSELYTDKLSDSSETVTESFVDNTVTIMTRAIIPNADLKETLETLDDEAGFNGPFSFISKMLVCVQKSGTPELVRWSFFAVIDLFRSGELPVEGISERALRGVKGTVGIVELCCFKHSCKAFFLGAWLDSMLTDAVLKDLIRQNLSSHAAYRKSVNPLPDREQEGTVVAPDMSWQKGWPHSTTLLVMLIEMVVYGRTYDASLRAAIKNQKTMTELLETAQPLKEAIEDIRRAKVKEQTQKLTEAKETPPTIANDPLAEVPADHEQQVQAAVANVSTFLSLAPDSGNVVQKFVSIARRKLAANIVLKPPCKSPREVVNALSNSPIVEGVRGGPSGFMSFIWDQPSAGESMTSPHLRMPPLRADTLKLYATGVLMNRAEMQGDMTILPGDMFVFSDGGRRGLAHRLMRPLTDKDEKHGNKEAVKRKRVITVGYEQESLQKRRHAVRGWTPQLENIYVVAQPAMLNQMPTRKRKWFGASSSSNKGTLIAPVPVPGFEQCWALEWQTKKDILGEFRMPVGGKTEDDGGGNDDDSNAGDDDDEEVPPGFDSTGAKAKKRKDRNEGLEPVFYQSMKSVALWEEILHSLCISKGAVVFTAGDCNLLEACLKLNVPTLAFCLSDQHVSAMSERLVKKYLDLMADAESPFYMSEYAALAKANSTPASSTGAVADAATGKPTKPKPNAKDKDAQEAKEASEALATAAAAESEISDEGVESGDSA